MHFIKTLPALFVCLILLLIANQAYATIDPAKLAAEHVYQGAKISPDGKLLGMIIVKDGLRKLAVVKSSDFSSVGGVDFGSKQEVGNFFWANNERIVIEVWVNEPWDDRARYYGELYAIDYDGSRGEMIYGARASNGNAGSKLNKKEATIGWARIINLLPSNEKEILISSLLQSSGSDGKATVHRLNIYTGKLSPIVAGGPVSNTRFLANDEGIVKLAWGYDRNFEKRLFVFDNESKEYSELPKNQYGSAWYPRALDDTGKSLYFTDDHNQDLEGLFKLDLDSGKSTPIYTDKAVDVTSVSVTIDGSSAYAVRIDPNYPKYIMFNEASEEAKVFKHLLSKFPGYGITITSRSDDANFWVIRALNDVTASSYYLYNKQKDQLFLLFANMTDVEKSKLSESIPIKFQASDGQVINGYITYPVSIPETQSIPLVTLVHGGPHSRDYWEIDKEVQLLASQGYAVLRVNFRGSYGYGSEFYYASNKQWGDRVQKDIIEGTKWVIQQGGILQDKVCIMGASFGGYSAVMSSVLEPNLFRCAVATAGVYDIGMMFEEGDVQDRLWGPAALKEDHGTDKALWKTYSPVNYIDKLKANLLVVHGEQDIRVPIKHAEALMDQLDKYNKPYEKLIKASENHGFFDEQNRTEYYEKVVQFLEKHLK